MNTSQTKKNLFKFVATLFIVSFVFSTPLFAQGNGGQGRGMNKESWVQRNLERLTEAVVLTEVQTDAIKPVLEMQFDDQQELRTLMQVDREGARAEMQKLQASVDEKIIALLTEEQVPKYKAYREEMGQRGGRRGRGNGRGTQTPQ